jgi:hypothetical protein
MRVRRRGMKGGAPATMASGPGARPLAGAAVARLGYPRRSL